MHFATLDGLRGIAAVVVLGLHALDPFQLSYLVPHAGLAVDFFFLLSGFVICYAYEGRLLNGMPFSEFFKVRMIRLYPLVLFGLVFGFSVYVARFYIKQNGLDASSLTAFVLGIILIPTSLVHNEGWESVYPFNVPSWSLFFELVINFAYAAIVTRLSKAVLIALLCISGLALLAQTYVMGGVTGGDNWGNFLAGFGRVVYPFFLGVFLFRYCYRRPNFISFLPGWLLPLILFAALVWPAIGISNWLLESAIVLVVFPVIVSSAARDAPGSRITGIYLFLGRLSYPLYIVHYPIIRLFSFLARTLALTGYQIWILVAVEMACAVLFSLFVMKAYDEPVRKWLAVKWRRRGDFIEAKSAG
jgi:peptidoglycan/LPS O-acetylase OafA/YrhL